MGLGSRSSLRPWLTPDPAGSAAEPSHGHFHVFQVVALLPFGGGGGSKGGYCATIECLLFWLSARLRAMDGARLCHTLHTWLIGTRILQPARSASVQPSESTAVPEPCRAPEKYLLLDTEDELELQAMDDTAPAPASVL